jgi:dTDP-4-amino-4,6-dideoxygalactose transaminase
METIRLSRSVLGDAEMAAVVRVLRGGFLGMGAEVQGFERELAAFFGDGRQVVCVNTGTAALHLAVQACGIGPGDEVIVPAITYVACFQAVSATGATPVACDVLECSGTVDPEDAARRIGPRTKAIMPVHYAGGTGRLGAIYGLAAEHRLRVIEDAAHAFGGTFDARRIGATGDIVCFSFDGIKNITAGEGGAVVTADPQIAEQIRDARLLGVAKDTEKRFAGQRSWDFDVAMQGWRYHMSDIMAAIGRVQLTRVEEFAAKRIALARNYVGLLGRSSAIRLFEMDYGAVVPHIFPLRIVNGKRDAARQALLEANIQSGLHYKPNHLLSRYRSGQPPLPTADRFYRELLTIPLHPLVTTADQERVARAVLGAVEA